jgi:hypothetical protein
MHISLSIAGIHWRISLSRSRLVSQSPDERLHDCPRQQAHRGEDEHVDDHLILCTITLEAGCEYLMLRRFLPRRILANREVV